jgi:hypothetical protein
MYCYKNYWYWEHTQQQHGKHGVKTHTLRWVWMKDEEYASHTISHKNGSTASALQPCKKTSVLNKVWTAARCERALCTACEWAVGGTDMGAERWQAGPQGHGYGCDNVQVTASREQAQHGVNGESSCTVVCWQRQVLVLGKAAGRTVMVATRTTEATLGTAV